MSDNYITTIVTNVFEETVDEINRTEDSQKAYELITWLNEIMYTIDKWDCWAVPLGIPIYHQVEKLLQTNKTLHDLVLYCYSFDETVFSILVDIFEARAIKSSVLSENDALNELPDIRNLISEFYDKAVDIISKSLCRQDENSALNQSTYLYATMSKIKKLVNTKDRYNAKDKDLLAGFINNTVNSSFYDKLEAQANKKEIKDYIKKLKNVEERKNAILERHKVKKDQKAS